MARKKRPTRTTDDYLSSARDLSKLVPSLRKFKHRKTLKKSEKASIRRRERQCKNIPDIHPVSKQQAKVLGRRRLFEPGFQAIQLRNVAKNTPFKVTKSGDITVEQNGQRWIYWSLDKHEVRSRRAMRRRGEEAFNKQFPIEKVADLTAAAFAKYNVVEVHLWAHAGIVGDGFRTLNEFILWVNEKWNQGRYVTTRYHIRSPDIYSDPSDPGKWINGIAILVEPKEYTERRMAAQLERKRASDQAHKETPFDKIARENAARFKAQYKKTHNKA